MTKKNAMKAQARALQTKRGGKYQRHLRRMGGAGGGKPSGLFETLRAAVTATLQGLSITSDLENNRLFVEIDGRTVTLCTPVNETPKWPVYVLLPKVKAYTPSWQCETLDDVLTVLRWPDASPSASFASPNEIRDTLENDARHAWRRISRGHPTPEPLVQTIECENCRARLHINFGETLEDVEHIAYANWRHREAGRQSPSRTLNRGMAVAAIPPRCPLPSNRPRPSVPEPEDVDGVDDGIRALTRKVRVSTGLDHVKRLREQIQGPFEEMFRLQRAVRAIGEPADVLANLKAAVTAPRDMFGSQLDAMTRLSKSLVRAAEQRDAFSQVSWVTDRLRSSWNGLEVDDPNDE